MKAMIFAAGLGTRLKPLTDTLPKALVPLAGKTLLQWQIERLKAAGITDIVVNVHHFPDMIINYLRENNNFGCRISVSDERDMLLETGGGLRKAKPLLLEVGSRESGNSNEPILICNVDILSNIDIPTLLNAYNPDEMGVVVVSERDTQRYLLFDEENRLCGWTNIATGEIRPASLASSPNSLIASSPKVALLTGSTTTKQRQPIHEQLLSGEINLLIGTHALIEDSVQFANLGLCIIDEQHRFGVAQRAKLWNKNTRPPHILVMTATPIPRTLAMTVYGDLQVSIIDELPPGRKPVQTLHYVNTRRTSINQFIEQQINLGRQVYVVYPLIKENEKMELQDLQNGYHQLCQTFPDYRISMVHGQMRAKDKDEQMHRFASGETQILVATTVIEVGVNVPNASVMIIENAERFGLSQLHQLRGRVGRGAEQSYCILLTKVEMSKDTRKRMDIMVATNDGFRIAEADLQLRGPGDLEGTQQSGLPFELHIASLTTDGQLLDLARKAAMEILDADPLLEDMQNRIYKQRLDYLRIAAGNWGEIS